MASDEYADPLVAPASEGPDRLHYALGMMLDADDFAAEQRYHRGRLARALRYLFGTGTVVGLKVTAEPEGQPTTEIRVSAGLAIDPLGRLIELPRAVCLDVQRWFDAVVDDTDLNALLSDASQGHTNPATVDVFARFRVGPRGLTPAFATGPYDALDAVQPSRLRDGVEVSLVIRPDTPAPPAPVPPFWNDAAEQAARLDMGWREGSDAWDESGSEPRPAPLDEHGSDVDPRSVLLARLQVKTVVTPEGPALDVDPVAVDNTIRRMVPAIGLILRPT